MESCPTCGEEFDSIEDLTWVDCCQVYLCDRCFDKHAEKYPNLVEGDDGRKRAD